jgi:hypothetical protein
MKVLAGMAVGLLLGGLLGWAGPEAVAHGRQGWDRWEADFIQLVAVPGLALLGMQLGAIVGYRWGRRQGPKRDGE